MGEEEIEKAKKILWKSLGILKSAFLPFRIHIYVELKKQWLAYEHAVLLWKTAAEL